MDQTFNIVIDQLVEDEEFRDAFLRNPRKTLRLAREWGLPLCDSEVYSLLAMTPSVWTRVAQAMTARLQEAA
jgi:hypothetical protein